MPCVIMVTGDRNHIPVTTIIIVVASGVFAVPVKSATRDCGGGGRDDDDIGTQTPRTISPQEPFYSVFTVLS